MTIKYIYSQLMGGLGNQLFQYAACRALALRSSAELSINTYSGFKSDRIYKREFELAEFPIVYNRSGWYSHVISLLERGFDRFRRSRPKEFENWPWGIQIREQSSNFSPNIANHVASRSTWIRGYFQSENYFANYRTIIGTEIDPPVPRDHNFLRMGELLRESNAVAVGVRLFEEVPGSMKRNDLQITPIESYIHAAKRIADRIANPVFYVFCTKRLPLLESLNLPGETRYITSDEGFQGAVPNLWLFSQSKNFILSHSSFYWWGAWLSEFRSPGVSVLASRSFPGNFTVPNRWAVF